MTIAPTVLGYLTGKEVPFTVVNHRHTVDSVDTAVAAAVPSKKIAKAIVLKDEDGFMVVVVPAAYRLRMGDIHDVTGRPHLNMVVEDELGPLFADCERGAVPAVTNAYGFHTIWDESLLHEDEIFFEGGDHESLVRVGRTDLPKLMGSAIAADLIRWDLPL